MALDYKLIGQRIKSYRTFKKMTQYKLAEVLGVSNVYVSRIERGSAKISLEMLHKIAEALEVCPSNILIGVNTKVNSYLESDISRLLEKANETDKKLIYEIIKIVLNHQS